MGRLRDLRGFLDGSREVLVRAETGLTSLQEKYETFFAEVMRVRESELGQLIELTLADRSVLPKWYNERLDQVAVVIERDLDDQLSRLQKERADMLKQAEAVRLQSAQSEKEVLKRNRRLDSEEEELKERNGALLKAIAWHNRQIGDLGSGFGFFSNLFKMRRLAAEKARLDREQGDVAARIEALRARWKVEEATHTEREQELQSSWRDLESKAAIVGARIEALEAKKSDILIRSTIEKVLSDRQPTLEEPGDDDPPCPRCRMPNPPSHHLCHICAHRLGPDRQDFDGSLLEISEVNRHFVRFSEGMEACQQIIGLVRGMKSGIEAFTESVADVQASEDKYPLSKLQIDVPQASRDFASHFDRLADFSSQEYSLHPTLFAHRFAQYFAEIFTEEAIQSFFETMGDELSKQAETQWK